MAITFNPNVNYSPKIAFQADKLDLSASNSLSAVASEAVKANTEQPQKQKKGFFASIAYAWVNFIEGTKGIVKGLVAGALTGTAVAGTDWIVSGYKKHARKEIKFAEMFNRKKAMSKKGKILAPVSAALVFVGYLISARLKANKRTANVDHMLYDGHRSKY